MKERININRRIRAPELRVVTDAGENLGVVSLADALREAETRGLDLIEISPNATPPVAKIMDYGKFQYLEKKKQKQVRGQPTETKTIQVKIGTGEHDLGLKARRASEFLREGHRVKIDLFLAGRAKYLEKGFLRERLERILHLITEEYKIADGPKAGPKGPTIIIERVKK
ncbi:MAG: translation initiation factor IF-3 [Parcubacteria group bacterium]|nr:translation initiation factor IF-3 [Parcubacteria group bacterium]